MLRALAFNLYFFSLTTLLAIAGIGVRIAAPHRAYDFARFWCRLVLAGAERICGITLEITGAEHLPAAGPALLACQHQSAYDTFLWMLLLPRTSYVLKKELTIIPLFGPLLGLAGMIAVNRKAGGAALRRLMQAADAAKAEGRQIVIFPEGTRVSPGTRVPLQPGIAAIAARLNLPVIPVATDSGRRWGRRAFRKHAGIVHVAIGAPIAAATPRAQLLDAIENHWRESERNGFQPVDNNVGKAAAPMAGTWA